MPTAARFRILALPVVLLGCSLAVARASRSPNDAVPLVELEVAGLLPLPEAPGGILVLREKGTETILAIPVPDGRTFLPGAGGGGLLGRAIEALGASVSEVELERTEEAPNGTRVRLEQGGKKVELRSSPSESLPLAFARGAPIVTTRRLLDAEGLTPEDLTRAHAKARGAATLRL
jgi:hypothetical protein